MADHLSPSFRPAFPSSAIISERSSLSRVRSAAPNNGAPLTAPGRSGQRPLRRGKGSLPTAPLAGDHFAAILVPFFAATDNEVTLFASGDSKTMATLVAPCERALWRDPACRETLPQHVRLMELVFRNASQFDVIHFHNDYLHFPLLRHNPTPTVTTLHGRLYLHDVQPLFREFAEVPLVSISDYQRCPLPDANWQATVYHGLPRDTHTVQHEPGEYLVFVVRVSPEKRLDLAIEIARRAGRKLKVAAKIYDEDRGYYQQSIEPLLQASKSFVEFVGEVGGSAK